MTTEWKVGISYKIGDIVLYDNQHYECRQSHTSQDDWKPHIVLALWLPINAPNPKPEPPIVIDPPIIVNPPKEPPKEPPIVVDPPKEPEIPAEQSILLAPYLYTWGLGNKVYKISSCMDIHNKLKGNAVSMAFVIGDSTANMSQDIYNFLADFKSFRENRGQLIISFGGANGPYLEDILSVEKMVEVISELLEKTGCRAIDFDIEGAYIGMVPLNDKRAKVIVALQKKYFGLYVSFTLAADRWGIPAMGRDCIQNAINNGVSLSIINIMAMNVGMLPPGKSWGAVASEMGDTTLGQMKALYPKKTSAELYRMLGITVMIGRNDDGSVFMPSDATIIGQYAKDHNIGLLSYWAINRDQIGEGGLGIYSQVNKSDFEFFINMKSAIGKLGDLPPAGSIPPVTPPIIITPPGENPPAPIKRPINFDQWYLNVQYRIGDKLTYKGKKYVCIYDHISLPNLTPWAYRDLWKLDDGVAPSPGPSPSPNPEVPDSDLTKYHETLSKHEVVYYHANWDTYSKNYQIKDLPIDYTPTIAYSFFNVRADGTVFTGDSYADYEKNFVGGVAPDDKWEGDLYKGNLGQFYNLKKAGKKFNLMLACGGWTWSKHFSSAVSTAENRKRFVDSVIEIFNKTPIFVGIEIDWEYLSDGKNWGLDGNGVSKDDPKNCLEMLKLMRKTFDETGRKHFIIGMCLVAAPEKIAFPVGDFVDVVNNFEIMGYDFSSGAWGETVSCHAANLYPNPPNTIYSASAAVDAYIKLGVPASKILIGVALYLRGSGNSEGLGKKCSGASPDIALETDNSDYNQFPKPGATEYFDEVAKAAYSYDPVRKIFNSYDDVRSVKAKCDFVKQKGLKGLLVWKTSGDFPITHERSIMKTIYDNLIKK